MSRFITILSPVVLALILVMAGCDSNDSSMNDAGDDNGNGDSPGEISYLIQIGAISGGSADLAFSYECFDEEGASTGGSGSGTVSAATNSFATNMCHGFGIVLEATYTAGTSSVDVRILGNEDEVLAEQTLQGSNNAVTFRLGTAPDS